MDSNGANATSPWRTLPVDDVLVALSSSQDGLSSAEALARRQTYGPNRLFILAQAAK
jgi:hypothetical protein